MASTCTGKRALGLIAVAVVALFIVDLVLLARIMRDAHRRADRPPAGSGQTTQEAPTAGGTETTRALEAKYSALAATADALQARVSELEAEAALQKQAITTQFTDHETLRSEKTQAEVQLASTQEALASTRTNLDAATTQLEELRGKLTLAADVLARFEADLNAAKERAAKLETDLTAANNATVTEKARGDTLQKSLDDANKSLDAAMQLIDSKTKEVAALQARVTELEQQLGGGGESGEGTPP
jgi:chromosome segregation ATPase